MNLPARLTDQWFEAHFIASVGDDGSFRVYNYDIPPMRYALAQAQGLFLWCPCGYGAIDQEGKERFPLDLSLNLGRPHGVLIVFANPPCGRVPPANFGPKSRDGKTHPRWTVSGTGLSDLTLNPSVAVGTNDCWHGYITNGEIR
jgi:hypothetical protein